MASTAATINVTTSAADFDTLDDPSAAGLAGGRLRLTNTGSNPVWVHTDGGLVADSATIAAEGDDMALVAPNYGELVVPYVAKLGAVATGGASKVAVMLETLGR